MLSLNAAFKKVYEKELEPYGFKKIKGCQPYFARMVGDEIAHVITYMNYPSLRDGYKEFATLGGVATVYRPRINLDERPRNNTNWFDSNIGFYRKSDFYDEQKDMFEEWYTFSYEEGNEESMIKSVKESFSVTEQVMLPILNKVDSLKACRDYFRQYMSSLLCIYDIEQQIEKGHGGYYEYNESLINFLTVDLEKYIENQRNDIEKHNTRTLDLMKRGKIGLTVKDFETRKDLLENDMREQITRFESCLTDEEIYARIMKELESRKKANLQVLQKYGLI